MFSENCIACIAFLVQQLYSVLKVYFLEALLLSQELKTSWQRFVACHMFVVFILAQIY